LDSLSAGVKALKKLKGLQEQKKNISYGGAYGMGEFFGIPRGATSYFSTDMPIAMAAPIRWQPPVALRPALPPPQPAVAHLSQPQWRAPAVSQSVTDAHAAAHCVFARVLGARASERQWMWIGVWIGTVDSFLSLRFSTISFVV